MPMPAQTAREFYNELYAVGGLDQIISEHVCFDEQPELQTFFIFTNSKRIREVMLSDKFMIEKTPARIRFNITLETMRYKRSVELLNPDGTIRSVIAPVRALQKSLSRSTAGREVGSRHGGGD